MMDDMWVTLTIRNGHQKKNHLMISKWFGYLIKMSFFLRVEKNVYSVVLPPYGQL